jgi:hypothetical protein
MRVPVESGLPTKVTFTTLIVEPPSIGPILVGVVVSPSTAFTTRAILLALSSENP